MQFPNYKGHIEYSIDEASLLIRFRHVPPHQFSHILGQFQNAVQVYRWNKSTSFWEVPHSTLEQVALFSQLYFGQGSMMYVGKGNPPLPKQLEMFSE